MSNFSIPTKKVDAPDHAEAGRLLRAKREKLGVTPTQHAAKMGISTGYLNLLESGKRTWSPAKVERYLRALK